MDGSFAVRSEAAWRLSQLPEAVPLPESMRRGKQGICITKDQPPKPKLPPRGRGPHFPPSSWNPPSTHRFRFVLMTETVLTPDKGRPSKVLPVEKRQGGGILRGKHDLGFGSDGNLQRAVQTLSAPRLDLWPYVAVSRCFGILHGP